MTDNFSCGPAPLRWAIVAAFGVFAEFAMPSCMAWGAGHDLVNGMAYDRMPQELRGAMPPETKERLVKWSHAPDDFTPWEKLEGKCPLDQSDRDCLAARKMPYPYSMHKAEGQAFAAIRLAKAFQGRDFEKAAYWMACLLHVMADESACNHDPLLEYMLCAFMDYGVEMGQGAGFDVSDLKKTPEGRKALDEAIRKPFKAPDPGAEPETALRAILLQGLQGNAFLTRRGGAIAASYSKSASGETLEKARTALAEIGVEGMDRGLFAICAAWSWAKAGRIPEFDEAAAKAYAKGKEGFVAGRPLSDDSLFAPLLAASGTAFPCVGVIVEPSVSMDEAALSFSSKYIAASIMRTLAKEGRPCSMVDLRSISRGEVPSPGKIPVLAFCSGPLNLRPEALKALNGYVAAGGRLLCVGGEHKGLLGPVSASLSPMPTEFLPVSYKYGCKSESLPRTAVLLKGIALSGASSSELRFIRDPNTKIGWQQPKCRYMSSSRDGSIETLASLRVDEREFDVAVIERRPDGSYGSAFIPEYLVAPFLLSEKAELARPEEPELDPVAKGIVLKTLAKQAPAVFAPSLAK